MGTSRRARPRVVALAVVCALTATLLGGSPALAVAPVAQDDAFSVAEDGTLNRSAGLGVLSNDTDADTDLGSVTAILIDDVNDGTLTLNADGSLNQARVRPQNAGFGAVSSWQAPRTLQAYIRFKF